MGATCYCVINGAAAVVSAAGGAAAASAIQLRAIICARTSYTSCHSAVTAYRCLLSKARGPSCVFGLHVELSALLLLLRAAIMCHHRHLRSRVELIRYHHHLIQTG